MGEVSQLGQGECFGERALGAEPDLETASVVAIEPTIAMTLTKESASRPSIRPSMCPSMRLPCPPSDCTSVRLPASPLPGPPYFARRAFHTCQSCELHAFTVRNQTLKWLSSVFSFFNDSGITGLPCAGEPRLSAHHHDLSSPPQGSPAIPVSSKKL